MERECMEKINHYCQKHKLTLVYANVRMTGPPHDPEFTVVVKINDVEYGTGTGKNKKEAKAVAAKNSWEMIEKQMESEESKFNSPSSEHGNSPRVPTPSDSDSSCCRDSAAELVEKMKDVAVCEKPSPFQGNAPRLAPKHQRKMAANFENARNKEEKRKMSDLDESLPSLDTNSSEENGSPYTVNKRFLDSFKNIEPIGEGGFGNVFKATAKLDERTYAVKRVDFTNNVRREVKGLARLDHENIVRYYCSWEGYDCVKHSDSRQKSAENIRCVFIQMEFCEQGSLENWIEKNRKERKYHDMAENKFLQILKGVEYIHSEGLIHRDLKPQNIFISHEDKIKIGDFGLVTSAVCGTLTENTGTSSYMAPEQVWRDVRDGKLPESFSNQFATKAPIIKKMLSRDSSGRYSASEILEFSKSVDKVNFLKTHTR
ncbi:interferon-induced, double-stranded RNA-activated protein kinase isoform X2 [Egretta garzetta]|uniref:interferon-induced, double-stranded RNA-activated protein kinase isoform X2 n=1 Tax=Egretta garzetta TaxID=188379 RepID=UPI00163CE98B|nr:interferon-induced, double-stranded RNA-activated protein kinase isoform X2 [Egretta garzetta]